MFPEVNALPRAQAKTAVRHRDAEVDGGQSRPDVGRHVIGPLDGVLGETLGKVSGFTRPLAVRWGATGSIGGTEGPVQVAQDPQLLAVSGPRGRWFDPLAPTT